LFCVFVLFRLRGLALLNPLIDNTIEKNAIIFTALLWHYNVSPHWYTSYRKVLFNITLNQINNGVGDDQMDPGLLDHLFLL